MNPNENGVSRAPRNDFLRLADQIIEDNPEYTRGAEAVKEFVKELVDIEFLPQEVVLKSDVEDTPPSQQEPEKDNPIYHHMLFDYDRSERKITLLDGKVNDLTKTENEILKLLSSRPNEMITTREIVETVFGPRELYSDQYLNVWISRLRRQLPFWDGPREHSVIKRKRELGIMFYDSSRTREVVVEREEERIIEIPQVKEVIVYKHRLFDFRPESNKLIIKGEEINLTNYEARFLEALSKSEVATNEALLELADNQYYEDMVPDVQFVRVHMSNLRIKFKKFGIDEEVIGTIFGKGYRLLP